MYDYFSLNSVSNCKNKKWCMQAIYDSNVAGSSMRNKVKFKLIMIKIACKMQTIEKLKIV